MKIFSYIFQWDDQKGWDWIPSQKYLMSVENPTCSVGSILDGKMDHTILEDTSPVQTLAGVFPHCWIANSTQCSMLKLNRASIYGHPHTESHLSMPWQRNGWKKTRRLSELENSPLNHIFSMQRRFLLVLSQRKLTTVNSDDKLGQLLQFSHCLEKKIRAKCRKLIHPETQRWG